MNVAIWTQRRRKVLASLIASAGTAMIPRGGRAAPIVLADFILRNSRLLMVKTAFDVAQSVATASNRIMAEVNVALAGRVAVTKPGAWVIASSGWHEGQIAEGCMADPSGAKQTSMSLRTDANLSRVAWPGTHMSICKSMSCSPA